MTRYFVIGLLAFFSLCVALVPAELVRCLLAESELSLRRPHGTIWSGGGELHLSGQHLGSLKWRFDPAKLLDSEIAYKWEVTAKEIQVRGYFAAVSGRIRVTATGHFSAVVANTWLHAYSTQVSGKLQLLRSEVVVVNGHVQSATGQLKWSKGEVEYQGDRLTAPLPPLDAHVKFDAPNGTEAPRISARVLTWDKKLLLVEAKSAENGKVQIGFTARSLGMLESAPWFPDWLIPIANWLMRMIGIDDEKIYTCEVGPISEPISKIDC